MDLAVNIVTTYHDAKAAETAKNQFIEVFSKGGLPEDISCIIVQFEQQDIVSLLTENNLTESKSEARRLIEGGGVKVDQKKITDIHQLINLKKEVLIQVGKRKFVKFKQA
jgi:tyrosyl-tRNA synthetase